MAIKPSEQPKESRVRRRLWKNMRGKVPEELLIVFRLRAIGVTIKRGRRRGFDSWALRCD